MKYTITESRILNILTKYLNSYEWVVYDYPKWNMKRVFFKDKTDFPEDIIFETYTYEDEEEEDENYKKRRILLVKYNFFNKFVSLFGVPVEELSQVLIDWYNKTTGDDAKFLEFM